MPEWLDSDAVELELQWDLIRQDFTVLENMKCDINLPLGKMCVHLRLFEVSLIVTWDGSKGLIRALDSSGGEPSDPITILMGGDKSLSKCR